MTGKGEGSSNAADEGEKTLDFSSDPPSQDQKLKTPTEKLYDPRPIEDGARKHIAYLLIGLLYLIVVGILSLLYIKDITVENLKDFSVILGPIVTLVSAATGFYYGTKSSSNGS